MATLPPSCRLIPQAAAAAAAPFAASVAARPPPSTSAFVPPGPGCCQPRRCLSLLNRHRPPAIRPCLVVRAHNNGGGGGALPAWPQPGGSGDHRRFFDEERKRVMDCYDDIIHIDHGFLYMEATKMSGDLCLLANQALIVASRIMSSARLNLAGAASEEISADTVHTTLRAYVKIFVDAAGAAHGRTVSRTTATSFLGALRGLASVSHILLDAALDGLSRTHPRESLAEYTLNCDVEAMRCELARKMDAIEDAVRKAKAADTWCKVAMPGIMEATKITGSLVGLMVARRERALGKANSKAATVCS